ncbi:hypothetical protein I4U23_018539 [Adineta vaga]|nr:hypothetical protein I4U23_018539 [Adineta vaga]
MFSTDENYQHYPIIKQSKVRKLCRYASSISSNGSGSSVNNSPNSSKQKLFYHNGDTDDGYASFTTTSTLLGSNNSSTLHRDDSLYYTSGSEGLLSRKPSLLSRTVAESESDKSQLSDDDDLEDLVDWSSLNQQVRTLVSRFDKWLHNPLPDRCIPIKKSYVEHAYPVLQRRTSSIPLAINLATDDTHQLSNQSNYAVNFVQNNYTTRQKSNLSQKSAQSHVHFNLHTEQLQHCTTCSRLIQLTSAINTQRLSITCPYCEQIYCSKICQKSDWPIHKRQCRLANSYSCCGHILYLMKSNICVLKRLSTLASSGYLSSGRGATLLYFDNMKEADLYVQSDTIENTRLMAIYWALTDEKTTPAIENLRTTEYEHLKTLCMKYDPSTEFVCHVTIRVDGGEKNISSNTCVSRTIVYKLVKSPLNYQENLHSSSDSYPTLYLTSLNYDHATEDHHHMRQVFFAKLQVELRERGIEIEQHYPELYHKLCDYISTNSNQEYVLPFTPICLFMKHRHTQQLFMCVITPESEPDRSWLLDRCLIERQLTHMNN